MGEDNELSKEEIRKSDQDKWSKKLSGECGVDQSLLKSALEELSESCYMDSPTAKDIIEELTLSCHFDKKEMEKFIKTISKNCPIDARKLKREIVDAKGNKDEAWRVLSKTWQRYQYG
jgi:hypothetical protein